MRFASIITSLWKKLSYPDDCAKCLHPPSLALPFSVKLWTRNKVATDHLRQIRRSSTRVHFNLRRDMPIRPKWIRMSITVSTRGACIFNDTSDDSCLNTQRFPNLFFEFHCANGTRAACAGQSFSSIRRLMQNFWNENPFLPLSRGNTKASKISWHV